jgi:hypothetical protein
VHTASLGVSFLRTTASAAALAALKTVSMIRRPRGNHPTKVGSDIHDLVRIVRASVARSIARHLVATDSVLAGWVAHEIDRAFGDDLRYTLVRLRSKDRSAGARALTDEDIAATIILADEINEGLSGEPDDAPRGS